MCKKNNFKILNFSKNFSNTLRKSKLLITNSGLTKYEAVLNGIPVIVFSDSKKSEKIDKIFLKKTKQRHFSYLKREEMDALKLKMTLKKKLKLFDKNLIKTNIENIKKFFQN